MMLECPFVGEFAKTTTGCEFDLAECVECLLTEWGQFAGSFGFFEIADRGLVVVFSDKPAGTVATVMLEMEWFVAGRRRGLGWGFAFGVWVSTEVSGKFVEVSLEVCGWDCGKS